MTIKNIIEFVRIPYYTGITNSVSGFQIILFKKYVVFAIINQRDLLKDKVCRNLVFCNNFWMK